MKYYTKKLLLFITILITATSFSFVFPEHVYADDPITVASAEEFKTKLNNNAGNFIQIADFTLPSDWTGPTNFHGTYDGNGYTIKGNPSASETQWLFDYINVKNWTVNIKNVYLEDAGMLSGFSLGASSTTNYLNITNCHIDIYKNISKTVADNIELQANLSLFVGDSGSGNYSGRSYGNFKDSSIKIHDNVSVTLESLFSGDPNGNVNGRVGGIGLFASRGLDVAPNSNDPSNLSFDNCYVYLGQNAKVIYYYTSCTITYSGDDAGVGGFIAHSRGLYNIKFNNCYVFMDQGSEMKSVKRSGGGSAYAVPVGSFFGSVKGKVNMSNCYCFNFGKLGMESQGTAFTNDQKNAYLHLDIGYAKSPIYNITSCKFFIDTTKNVGIGTLTTGVFDSLSIDDLTDPTVFSGMIDETDDYSDNDKLFIMDPAKTVAPGGGTGLGMPYLKQEVENQIEPEVVEIPFTGKVGEMTIEKDAETTAYTLGDLSTITVDIGDETTPDIKVVPSDKITSVDGVSTLYLDITVSQDELNALFTEDDIGKEFVVTYAFTSGKVVRGKYKIVDGNYYPSPKKKYPIPNTGID